MSKDGVGGRRLAEGSKRLSDSREGQNSTGGVARGGGERDDVGKWKRNKAQNSETCVTSSSLVRKFHGSKGGKCEKGKTEQHSGGPRPKSGEQIFRVGVRSARPKKRVKTSAGGT